MKSPKSPFMNRILRTNKGSVLPQIIATSALVGALAVGILNLTKNSGAVVKYEAQRSLEDKFRFEVYNALRKKSACTTTLAGVNVANGTTGFTDLSDGFKVFASTDAAKNDIFGKSEGAQINANSTAIKLLSMQLKDYAATGVAYRENGSVGYKRAATTVLEINYQRDGNYAASAGNANQRLNIPLQVVHNSSAGGATGTITECNIHIVDGVDQRSTGLCQSLGGLIDTDGNCRHISVQDGNAPNNDYAATFKGNVNIEESKFNYQPAFPNKNNHLRVEGSVGIGRDPIDHNDDGGELSVDKSLVIGPVASIQPNEAGYNEAGVAYINNSVGVGLAPNTAKGSLVLNESLSVGSNFPSVSPVNQNDGDLAVKNAVVIGGNIDPQTAATPGSLEVKKTLYVTALANPATKPDGAVFVQGANSFVYVGDGATTGDAISNAQNSGARGNIKAEGFVNIPSQSNSFAPASAAERKRAATMGWTANKVSQTISPSSAGDVAQVMTDIQDSTTPNGKGFISICKGMFARNPDTPTTFIQGVPAGFSTCDVLLKHCSHNSASDPVCQKIYAQQVISAGAITTTGSGAGFVSNLGNITANNGNITANASGAQVIGLTVQTDPSGILSLNSCDLNNWSSINIGTDWGSCVTRSNTGTCNNGYYGVSVTPVYSTLTYSTNASRSGTTNTSQKYVSNVNMKCCKMINYKCGTTPVTPPADGACGASTNTCASGSVTGATSDAYNYYWNCSVAAPGASASCTEAKTTDGACGASTNTCTAGVFADTADEVIGSTTVPTWNCNGLGGGSSIKCYSNYPEDGMCPYDENGETHIQSCDGGTLNNLIDNGTFYTWDCLGINGGSDTDCTMYKAACGATINTCNDGAASGATQDSNKWSWYCTGGTVLCEKGKPKPGQCSSSHYGCTVGTLASGSTSATSTSWSWTCDGVNGGSSTSCSETRPGSCAPAHYSCLTGTSTANNAGSTKWTWTCSGSTNASCSEDMPVTGTCAGGETEYATMSACTSAATGCYAAGGTSTYAWSKTSQSTGGSCGVSDGGSCNGDPEVAGKGIMPAQSGYPCNAGTVNDTAYCHHCGTGTYDRFDTNWKCNENTAGSVYCGVENTGVNGSCGTPQDTCTAGTFSDTADTSTQYKWKCLGTGGGSDVNCTYAKPCTNGDTRVGSGTNFCCDGAGQYYCEGNNRQQCTAGSWVDTGTCSFEICRGASQMCP